METHKLGKTSQIKAGMVAQCQVHDSFRLSANE